MKASVLLRGGPDYRRDAFCEGLMAAGYKVSLQQNADPGKDDVLVIWNRYGYYDAIAKRYDRCGATVIVAENGWIGRDEAGHKVYAICFRHHNGAGWWREGPPGRFAKFGVEIAPWRADGEHILVLPQRGIGPPGVAMPQKWLQDVISRLRSKTNRKIVVRPHPGAQKSDPDFTGVWAAVTWGSGAGIKALAAGIPVFHEMPNWIGGLAAVRGIDDLENPFLGDRMMMFERLAYAQWTLDEIRRGEPFRCLP